MHKTLKNSKCLLSYTLVLAILFCSQISNIYNSNSFVEITEFDLYLGQLIYPDGSSEENVEYYDSFSLEFEWDGYDNDYDEEKTISQLAYMPYINVLDIVATDSTRVRIELFSSIPSDLTPPIPSPA